ncbi:TPA: hypothetical protein JG855_001666 [Vibrio parahaemolyticus]|nr:hypothetical protein [Vibrio parahaemolyticus]MBE3803936.1 hypothetical protein [Vibrio parahaemolyticus]MBE3808229.1 hypothetical protein [Vibrio parahaemolyticus]MBE4230081.1 hypothetical protein [Vibrio parahaemolyticus]MBE4395055.1 hypothetical protein [Vibrio parahaemolyticus]
MKKPYSSRNRPSKISVVDHSSLMKRVFSMPLRALQGFTDSVFALANVPLVCPNSRYIIRRAN